MAEPSSASQLSNQKKMRTPPSLQKSQSQLVTILIGPEKEKFVVHQDFLTFNSQYFARCLEGSYSEAETKVVKLPDVKSHAFGFFVEWIYTKIITSPYGAQPTHLDSTKLQEALVDAWILGEYFIAPEFQNECMDTISGSRPLLISSYTFNATYDKTKSGSPLRKYLVDEMVFSDVSLLKTYHDTWPYDFLLELAIATKEQAGKVSPRPNEGEKPINYYVKVVKGEK